MSDRIEDGGPAYPVPGDQPHPQMNGMSLRDHFAAQALPPVVSGLFSGAIAEIEGKPVSECDGFETSRALAVLAYEMADAMLAARKGGQS